MKETAFLREYMERARACGLKVDVPASGDPNAEIAIVCEAPGVREKEMRMPLVGGAGQQLWDVMNSSKVKIRRNQCYVTNVIKRQVSLSTKGNKRAPLPLGELQHWQGLLIWELENLPNLKYVLVLGDYALYAITRQKGVTKWRGSVIDQKIKERNVKLIIANNPAMVKREPKLEVLFRYDIGKLRKVIDGNYEPYHIKHLINPSCDEAIAFIDKMQTDGEPVAFDIETGGNETTCVGLANDPHEGMCIPFRTVDGHFYTILEEKRIWIRLQKFFADPTVRLVAQNGNFDSYWLWFKNHIRIHGVWFDTMLAHHCLYPQLPHGLGPLTAQYTTHPFYKDDKDEWYEGGDLDGFWRYNVKDCCITLACQRRILKELQDQGLADFFFSHIMRLTTHLVGMTVTGVNIDHSLKDGIMSDLSTEVDLLRAAVIDKAYIATGKPDTIANPGSPAQIGKLLFGHLGLIGRGFSTDKDNLARIKNHPRTPELCRDLVQAVIDFRKDAKFLSTYIKMKLDDDGRIRCEYKQIGVEQAPGRLSSTQTMWGSGTNLQNQPQRAYPMFIADDEYEFSYFDSSQAEARVVAWQWNVTALKENFIRGLKEKDFDIHRANASRIFQVPIEEIPKEDWNEDNTPTKRYLGKRCVHGLNYRMGPDRLATVCKIPISQATTAYNAYHAAFPEIKRAWDGIISEVRSTRRLFTPLGRRLFIMERLADEALDSIIAFIPQSTIGDKTCSCIYLCHDHKDWPKTVRKSRTRYEARCVLNIHDAIIALNTPDHGDLVRGIMKEVAEIPLIIKGEEVKIPAELKKSKPDEFGLHRWSSLE